MAFDDYRNNDLAKYRSTFAEYLADAFIGRNEKPATDTFYDLGTVSGTVELALSSYSYFKMEIGDDVLISGSHTIMPKNLNSFSVEILTDGTNTIEWDTWFDWSSGIVPDLTASGTYMLLFVETNTVVAGAVTDTKCMGYLG